MRGPLKTIAVLATAGLISGCYGQHWPREIGGGMAEWSAETAHIVAPDDVRGFLHSRVEAVTQELERLAANGGNRAVAADMLRMNRTVIAIRREIAGELFAEAEKRLFAAELKISQMKAVTAAFQRTIDGKAETVPTTL